MTTDETPWQLPPPPPPPPKRKLNSPVFAGPRPSYYVRKNLTHLRGRNYYIFGDTITAPFSPCTRSDWLHSGNFDGQEYQVGLSCGLFPRDFEFEKDTLIQLWMAMGLYKKPLDCYGNDHFERLVKDGFITKSRTDILGGKDKYKIDVDKVTTFSEGVKSKDRYTYALVDDDNGLAAVDMSKCRHLSIASKTIEPATFKALNGITELRTFLLISSYGSSLKQMPSVFFTAHPYMQALDLSGSHLSELPSSIGDMTLLRYLDLSFTLLERIPETTGSLQNLQTLKLKGCKHLRVLPKGIKQLLQLRYLDFDVLGQLNSMPKEMGLLTELRALSAFIVSDEDGCSLRELKNLNNLCGSFCISGLEYASPNDASISALQNKDHLTWLHLKWSDSKSYDETTRDEAYFVLGNLSIHSSVQELIISYYPETIIPPQWFMINKTKLVTVTLLGCKIELLFALERLPNLEYLNITDLSRVTCINHAKYRDGVIFRNLKKLAIDGMHNLESWTGVQSKDFPHLSNLSVKRCPKLTKLDFLPLLCSLKYLEISDCKSFESLPGFLSPTPLETLMINNCPSLKKRCSKGGEDWENIKDVPNIWINMRGIGSANQCSSDSDCSDDDDSYSESNCSDEDSDEVLTTHRTTISELKYASALLAGSLSRAAHVLNEYMNGTTGPKDCSFGLYHNTVLDTNQLYARLDQ